MHACIHLGLGDRFGAFCTSAEQATAPRELCRAEVGLGQAHSWVADSGPRHWREWSSLLWDLTLCKQMEPAALALGRQTDNS